jgi:hypothetical protein
MFRLSFCVREKVGSTDTHRLTGGLRPWPIIACRAPVCLPAHITTVSLICRQAVEQPAGALKPILATVARGVGRVPRLSPRIIGEAGTVTVSEHGSADGTRSPILTGHVLTRQKRFPVWLRAGQYIAHVGRIFAAVDRCALLSQTGTAKLAGAKVAPASRRPLVKSWPEQATCRLKFQADPEWLALGLWAVCQILQSAFPSRAGDYKCAAADANFLRRCL